MKRANSINNQPDSKTENSDTQGNLDTVHPDSGKGGVNSYNKENPSNTLDEADLALKRAVIEGNSEVNKHIIELQKKRIEEKKLLKEQAQKDKEFVIKQMHIKPIVEKIEESKEEDSEEVAKELVNKPSSPEVRPEVKDLNQFDFSKLVEPKKPTVFKPVETVKVMPKFVK